MRNLRAWWTTLFIPLVILILYLLLQGTQGEALHVTRDGRFMYVALGEIGTFQLYEVRTDVNYSSVNVTPNPNSRLIKMARNKKPLDKSQLKVRLPLNEISISKADIAKIIVEGNFLYLLNPNEGFIIIDNEDRNNPKQIARIPFYDIRDLAFYQGLAFIAAGSNGVYILDLSNPNAVQYLAHTSTPCEALNILPTSFEVTESGAGTGTDEVKLQNKITKQYLAFVACSEQGVIVLNYLNVSKEPRQVVEVNKIQTGGFAYDVTFKDSFLFVANGAAGIQVYDTFGLNPGHPIHLGVMDTPGIARQVIFHNNHLFIADGAEGLYIARFAYNSGIAVFSETHSFKVNGGVSSLDVSKDIAFLTSGIHGTHLVDVANPSKLNLRQSFETPGLATTAEILAAVINPQLRSPKIWASVKDMIKELLFVSLALIVWGFLFVPLTQPFHSIKSLVNSIQQYGLYLLDMSGRVVFVENGQVMSPLAMQEISRYRPLILDNASAGLILDQEGELRVVGPGMDLLYPHQALVKLTSLRPRNFIYGPADEDPFEPQQEEEDQFMARQRALRRLETSGTTRDGVEVVPNIVIEFHVKGQPVSGGAPFGYHPAYAFQALRREFAASKISVGYQPGGPMDHLPGELAAQAWRFYLASFSLAELFSPISDDTGVLNPNPLSGLEQTINRVNQYLTRQYVDEVGEDGQPTGQLRLSEAYNELEQAGMEVQRVWIVNLRIEPDAAKEALRIWQNTWQVSVQEESAALEARYRENQGINLQRGQIDFVRRTTKPLQEGMRRYKALPQQFLYLNRSVHLLVRGTREMGGLQPADQLKLDEMLDWLERSLD